MFLLLSVLRICFYFGETSLLSSFSTGLRFPSLRKDLFYCLRMLKNYVDALAFITIQVSLLDCHEFLLLFSIASMHLLGTGKVLILGKFAHLRASPS